MTQLQLDILDDLLKRTKKAGADSADAMLMSSKSSNFECRNGKVETSTRSENITLGLRAFVGHRSSIVSTAEFGDDVINSLIDRAVATAKMAPEDPYTGIMPTVAVADHDEVDLDLYDNSELTVDASFEMAKAAETAALEVAGVTKSGGCGSNSSNGVVAVATTNGFLKSYQFSSFGIGGSMVAGDGTEMETDFDFRQMHHLADLPDPAEIGRSAGLRAAKAVGGRPIKTCKVPVVYDPRVSGGLVDHFASAINGMAVVRGTSFLKEMMGKQVFASEIQIIDDQAMKRGPGSRPFDGEGMQSRRLELVENGTLQSWLLDGATARQLGLETTASARRSPSAPPGPGSSNLYMAAGSVSPEELIADIEYGFYATGMIGEGINPITGDYSRGANGFLIEKGELTKPVKGVTIAGNLKDMFGRLIPANDLEFIHATNAPTVRIDEMMVAGE